MLLGGLAGLHCHRSVTSEAPGRKLCSNEKEGPQDREEEGTRWGVGLYKGVDGQDLAKDGPL